MHHCITGTDRWTNLDRGWAVHIPPLPTSQVQQGFVSPRADHESPHRRLIHVTHGKHHVRRDGLFNHSLLTPVIDQNVSGLGSCRNRVTNTILYCVHCSHYQGILKLVFLLIGSVPVVLDRDSTAALMQPPPPLPPRRAHHSVPQCPTTESWSSSRTGTVGRLALRSHREAHRSLWCILAANCLAVAGLQECLKAM